MNSFGLIIQQTIAGLSDQYVSDDLISLRNSKEILDSATDERMIATKLSNQSDVYAVQLTKSYRVYSLIVTNVSDFVGGAGFYAIRLYTPKLYPLDNFETILDELRNQYLDYQIRNVTKDKQDYTHILTRIMSIENNKQEFVYLNGKGDAFVYFDPNNTRLGTTLNSRGVYLFNKVYAFNKEMAVEPSVANSLGLVEFEVYQKVQKEITISDKQQLLNEVKINNQNTSFEHYKGDFIILAQENDVVTYNTIDDINFRTIVATYQSIESKPTNFPKSPHYPESPKKQRYYSNGILWIVMIMIIALGGGIYYLFIYDPQSNSGSLIVNDSTGAAIENIVKIKPTASQSIEFIYDTIDTKMSDSVYKTNYPKLDKYRFKLKNDKWFFKNTMGKNVYQDFYAKTIVEILKQDSLVFSESKKKEFVDALEGISKHKLNDKPILEGEINNKQHVKRSETTIKGNKKKAAGSEKKGGDEKPSENIIKVKI